METGFTVVFAIIVAMALVLAFGGGRPDADHPGKVSVIDIKIGAARQSAN